MIELEVFMRWNKTWKPQLHKWNRRPWNRLRLEILYWKVFVSQNNLR